MAIDKNIFHLINEFQENYLNQETMDLLKNTYNLQESSNQFQLTRFISCFAGNILSDEEQIILTSYNPNYNDNTDNAMNIDHHFYYLHHFLNRRGTGQNGAY